MIFTTSIIPLTSEYKNNDDFIVKAQKDGDRVPAPSHWQEIKYNAKSVEIVGDIEIDVSTVEKIKCFIEQPLEVGKPALVNVKFVAYNDNNNRPALSAKIISLATKA